MTDTPNQLAVLAAMEQDIRELLAVLRDDADRGDLPQRASALAAAQQWGREREGLTARIRELETALGLHPSIKTGGTT